MKKYSDSKTNDFDQMSPTTGGYSFIDGKSSIMVTAINKNQMERSTIHETHHFASFNKMSIIPIEGEEKQTVTKTVGLHKSSRIHSDKTGENYIFISKGVGLNEGVATLFYKSAPVGIK